MRVLYIDDECGSDRFQTKRDLLQAAGIDVLPVASVEEVFGLLEKQHQNINAIVLDILMPPEDKYRLDETNGGTTTGLRLLKDIKAHDTYRRIPVVVVSVKRRLSDEDLKRLSIHAYLEKPVLPSEIAEALRRAWRGA